MKNFLTWLDKRWHLFLIGGCIGLQALVFLIYREDSYLTVQDNLDLFIAHFRVMSETVASFRSCGAVPTASLDEIRQDQKKRGGRR